MTLASFQKLVVVCAALAVMLPTKRSQAQYEAGDGYNISWTLDPRSDTDHFPRGPAFGLRGALTGMDFDNDGKKEILFATDETVAPQGPDPGFLEVFLYENTGDDTYEYVWHYTHPTGSNSFPPIAYGDVDKDGLWEIYFGIPTIDPDPGDLFVFEQNDDLTFPDEPTTSWDYGKDSALDFRPSAIVIADIDGDGQDEIVTASRTSGAREIVVAAPTGAIDAFTVFASEFEAHEDLLGGGGIYDIDVADFDNDGMNEIWVNTWDLFSMTVFEATGADTYELQADINDAFPDADHGSYNYSKLLFNDIDGDGRDELLVPSTEGELFFLDDVDDVSTLTGASFVDAGSFLGDDGATSVRGTDIGDVDGDGKTDIVISFGTHEQVINLEFEGGDPGDLANYSRTVVLMQTDAATVDYYYSVRITDDLDGDGKNEIVVSNRAASDAGQALLVVVESTQEVLAGYEAGDGYNISWTLDPRSDVDLFSHGNDAYGARSVLVGMDFDNDGKKEFLFTTDETLAPGGPDPGFLDVFLYESNGNDSYEYVWHYTHPTGSNSLPALAYGDLDKDGLWEIYFGIPTIDPDPGDLFVFEQNADLTFPDTPTTTWDYGKPSAEDFRPAAFAIADVDGDGQDELVTGSRTSGARALVVASPNGAIDAFTVWTNEFEAGEDILGGGAIYDLDVADFDNDGKNEIWVNTWDLFSFAIFEATGTDTYELQADINQAYDAFDHGSFNSHKLLFNDLDGDGRMELVIPTTNGYLFYLDDVDDVSTITGPSFVEVGSFMEEGDGTETRGADIGDIDGDGNADIVIGLGNGEKVIDLEFQGGDPTDYANYERSVLLTQTAESADRFYPLRIADDLDGDGKKEIVVTNLKASEAGQQMIIIVESTGKASTAIEDRPEMPAGYVLSQNYPNPFNPSTTVVFEVPEIVNVEVGIFDVAGRLIQTLSSGVVSAGTHSVTFESQNLPSGVYMIVMQTPHGMLTRKAMLLK